MNTPASLTWAWRRWCASVWREQSARPGDPPANCCVPCGRWNNAILCQTTISSNRCIIKVPSANLLLLQQHHYPSACSISDLKPQDVNNNKSRGWRSVEKHRIYNFLGVATRTAHHPITPHVLFPICTLCFDNNTDSVRAPQDSWKHQGILYIYYYLLRSISSKEGYDCRSLSRLPSR